MINKITLFIVLMACVLTTKATIITVSNNPGSPAMYGALTDAVNAATAGDTLLVHASAVDYTFADENSFNKQLVVIGSGWNGVGTKILGINAGNGPGNRVRFNGGAEGSVFIGIKFTGAAQILISSLIFKNCSFTNTNASIWTWVIGGVNQYSVPASDILFENCHFGSGLEGMSDDSNLVFQNCIFLRSDNNQNNTIYLSGPTSEANTNPNTFDHCIFVTAFDMDFSNAIFRNNIFGDLNPNYSGAPMHCYNCEFTNNMTYCSSCLLSDIPSAFLTNNLENQPAPFVNPVADFNVADFNLIDSSLGNNYALDGSDVGVLGGPTPYPAGSNYGGTLIEMPVINEFSILNSLVPQGGNLNFHSISTMPGQ